MKSLVDIMGGTISVKSELGKGTEFIVDLYVPLAEAEVEEHSEENITENLMDARILLVEDSEINIYVAQLILEKAGCVVEIANGAYPVSYTHLQEARRESARCPEEQDGNRRKETGTEVAYGNEFYPGTAKGNRTA